MKTTKSQWQVSLLTLVSVLIAITNTIAQTTEAKEEKETVTKVSYVDDGFVRLKWDVGTNLTFLLNDNYGQGDILVRKNKVNRNKQWGITYSAIRYRVQFDHSSSTLEYADKPINKEEFINNHGNYQLIDWKRKMLQQSSFSASIGYEWQKYYGRFLMHYGYDVGIGGFMEKTADILTYFDRQLPVYERKAVFLPIHNETKGWDVSVSPLVGVKYFIHPMISISAETQIKLSYGRSHENSNYSANHGYYYGSMIPEEGATQRRETNLVARYTPVAFLGASFHFNK